MFKTKTTTASGLCFRWTGYHKQELIERLNHRIPWLIGAGLLTWILILLQVLGEAIEKGAVRLH